MKDENLERKTRIPFTLSDKTLRSPIIPLAVWLGLATMYSLFVADDIGKYNGSVGQYFLDVWKIIGKFHPLGPGI